MGTTNASKLLSMCDIAYVVSQGSDLLEWEIDTGHTVYGPRDFRVLPDVWHSSHKCCKNNFDVAFNIQVPQWFEGDLREVWIRTLDFATQAKSLEEVKKFTRKLFGLPKNFQQLLALANMVNGGKGFCIYQIPDYCGGHFMAITTLDYERKDFEYFQWEGTPLEFAQQAPTFWNHTEPFHEKADDYEISAEDLLRRCLEWGIRG